MNAGFERTLPYGFVFAYNSSVSGLGCYAVRGSDWIKINESGTILVQHADAWGAIHVNVDRTTIIIFS